MSIRSIFLSLKTQPKSKAVKSVKGEAIQLQIVQKEIFLFFTRFQREFFLVYFH